MSHKGHDEWVEHMKELSDEVDAYLEKMKQEEWWYVQNRESEESLNEMFKEIFDEFDEK